MNKKQNPILENPHVKILIVLGGLVLTVLGLIFTAFQSGFDRGKEARLPLRPQIPSGPIENIGCDSNFKNDKWTIDQHWERDEENLQRFTSRPNKELGGPKMTYAYSTPDNFHLSLDCQYISNTDSKGDPIDALNFILYIGDLYKLILGDGNTSSFSLKKNDSFVTELTTLQKENVKLPNKIAFDKWLIINIHQYTPSDSKTRNITITFIYTPDEIENAEPISTPPYIFQIDDDALPEKVSRDISLGLVFSEKSIIVTDFYCFKLRGI